MKKENEFVTYRGEDIIEVFCEVEYILISLRDIANYYYVHPNNAVTPETDIAYALETTRFIDENRINDRLNKIRRILASTFDESLGEDDMDDIERVVEKLKFWRKPGD